MNKNGWHDAGPYTGSGVYDIGADRVWVFELAGSLRALAEVCPHKMGPINEGELDPIVSTIECPWHGYRFHIDTGKCLTAACQNLRLYQPRIEHGRLYLREVA